MPDDHDDDEDNDMVMTMHGVVLAVLTCKAWCSMTRDCKRLMLRWWDIVMLDDSQKPDYR